MDRISPNFIYAYILTRSTLGLSHIIFRIFVADLWPLILFPLNILRTLTRSTLGLLAVIFRKFVRELWPLIDVRIALPLNILRHSGLYLHARHCSGAIVIFSDNSSYSRIIFVDNVHVWQNAISMKCHLDKMTLRWNGSLDQLLFDDVWKTHSNH